MASAWVVVCAIYSSLAGAALAVHEATNDQAVEAGEVVRYLRSDSTDTSAHVADHQLARRRLKVRQETVRAHGNHRKDDAVLPEATTPWIRSVATSSVCVIQ